MITDSGAKDAFTLDINIQLPTSGFEDIPQSSKDIAANDCQMKAVRRNAVLAQLDCRASILHFSQLRLWALVLVSGLHPSLLMEVDS